MKKLLTIVFTLTVAMFLAVNPAISKDGPSKGSWTGTLVDKHCGSDMTAEKLPTHKKDCVMKCAKNGKDLGMMVDGKWYAFDAKGEKLAWKLLKGSKADANIQVTVDGTLKGDKITITKIAPKA